MPLPLHGRRCQERIQSEQIHDDPLKTSVNTHDYKDIREIQYLTHASGRDIDQALLGVGTKRYPMPQQAA